MFTHSLKLLRFQALQSSNNARVSEEHSTPGHPGKDGGSEKSKMPTEIILLSREIDIKMFILNITAISRTSKKLPVELRHCAKTVVTIRFKPDGFYANGRERPFRSMKINNKKKT
uniref:Uncharacterized protein n=1 Tax=Glossina pallidipes TaxID=7398 RepID=A0A1A9ZSB0_GLOPL